MGLLDRVRMLNVGLRREATARRKITSEEMDWKALLIQEEGFLRGLVQAVIQQVLELEMEGGSAGG